jgi:hypothetical protein
MYESQPQLGSKQQPRMKHYSQQQQPGNPPTDLAGRATYHHKFLSNQTPLLMMNTSSTQYPLRPSGGNNKYKFQVMPGNNSGLVRRVLLTSGRAHLWQEVPN